VTITELTRRRVKGTFQIAMTGYVSSGAGEIEGQVQLRTGSFDVPLLDEKEPPFNRAAFSRVPR
jgi:hypothetical protein